MPTTIDPEALKEARRKAGLSQATVSQSIGVSQPTISYYETGQKRPTIPMLFALARLYRVKVESLVQESSEAA